MSRGYPADGGRHWQGPFARRPDSIGRGLRPAKRLIAPSSRHRRCRRAAWRTPSDVCVAACPAILIWPRCLRSGFTRLVQAYHNTARKCLSYRTPAGIFASQVQRLNFESVFPPAWELQGPVIAESPSVLAGGAVGLPCTSQWPICPGPAPGWQIGPRLHL